HPTALSHIYTLSLHDALPISFSSIVGITTIKSSIKAPIPYEPKIQENVFPSLSSKTSVLGTRIICSDSFILGFFSLIASIKPSRSEEHTSELQSRENLVCRLL